MCRWRRPGFPTHRCGWGFSRCPKLPTRASSACTTRFKSATGFAPLEYVPSLRLEAASELLEGSEEPVEEIAYRVGYENITFFRRLFRRQKGMTPAAYRRQFRAIHLGAL